MEADAPDLLGLFIAWRGLPPDAARRHLRAWRPVPLIEHGEVAAIALLQGTEIHFAAAPAWRGRLVNRGRTRAFLAPLMEPLGFLTTRSTGDADTDFLARLGFVETWREGDTTHWMLTALPFGREP